MSTSADVALQSSLALERDARYRDIADTYGAALARLARGYEPDAHARRDLLQEIHVALWQSLAGFDGRCSLRTWAYRVAHNVATAHLLQRRRLRASQLVDIDSLDDIPDERDRLAQSEDRRTVENVLRVIDRLKPLDRQLMMLYLEGVDGAEIAQIVGLSATNVGVRIHRIKQALRERFDAGDKR